MITAAVAGAQAHRLNYVEVEIVPKPSTGKNNGDKSVLLIGDTNVKYSTIIFPEKDGNATPRNSQSDMDPVQLSSPQKEPVSRKDSSGSGRSQMEQHCGDGKSTPPRRRRAHSSPSTPKGQVSLPLERCEQIEELNNEGKSRTLPSNESPWTDDVFTDDGSKHPRREENSVRALVAVEKAKQESTARKVKKFFRSGRHGYSDLGKTQDILQAVNSAQKKVRRKSSGESVDSGNDPGYPNVGQEPGPAGSPLGPQEGTVPASVRNPPPIPGSMRNTELEKAMTRRKLCRQASSDQKKAAAIAAMGSSEEKEGEPKNRSKFLNILPAMKFSKFRSKESKEARETTRQEEKSQQCKKPVPLPRYQRGQMGYNPSFEEGCDSGYNDPTGNRDISETDPEGDMYVNVVFQSKQHHEDRHNYENVSLEDNEHPSPRHSTSRPETEGPLRPMPAPRTNVIPSQSQKVIPPERMDKSPSRKTSFENPQQNGYETVSFKPPCLKAVESESFFPQHVGSSFEEDEGSLLSSCDEDIAQRNQDVELLALTFQKDAVVSKELKRGFENVVFKRNSDGSVRSMPEAWNGSNQYPDLRKAEDPDPGRRQHQKHNRSHSSGGQRAPIYAGVMKAYVPRGEDEMYPSPKGDPFRPAVKSSPPRQRREKRTPRNTHEQVTLGQHAHASVHSQSMKSPAGPLKPMGLHKPLTLHNPALQIPGGQHKLSNLKNLQSSSGQQKPANLHSLTVHSPNGPLLPLSVHKPLTLHNPAMQNPMGPQKPTGPHKTVGPSKSVGLRKSNLQKPTSLLGPGQHGNGPSDELKAKYLDDATPRTPPLGSPRLAPQSPWWDDDTEDEQLEEKPIHSYINQPWYYGKLLRQECDYLMLSKGKSCQYLVRDSSHRTGGLMLCVLYGQKVHHYIIQVISNTEYQMANHNFRSVSEIIEFYRKHIIMYSPSQEPVFLGEPFLYPR